MTAAIDADDILGHDDTERRRLRTQADLMEPLTRRALTAAGRRPGMRVLDVGAGFGDVRTDIPNEVFDAAIGRFVLMSDAVAALVAVAAQVRPGGIVALQEWHAIDAFTSTPTVELWERMGALLVPTFGAAGTHVTMGLRLRSCFEAAGLGDPEPPRRTARRRWSSVRRLRLPGRADPGDRPGDRPQRAGHPRRARCRDARAAPARRPGDVTTC